MDGPSRASQSKVFRSAMKLPLRSAVCIGIYLLSVASPAASLNDDSGEVGGRVLDIGTSASIRKATVVLTRVDVTPPQERTTLTNDAGFFRFTNVPSGRYRILGTHGSYLPQEYGAEKPREPGETFAVHSSEQVLDRNLLLTPQSIIRGRVVDNDGDPVAGVHLVAIRLARVRGRPKMLFSKEAVSTSGGEYTLSGLSQGRYYVRAVLHKRLPNLSGNSTEGPPEFGYATTFYPGVPDIASADPIVIPTGAEISGINVKLIVSPLIRISGRALMADGNPAAGASAMLADDDGGSMTIMLDNATRTGPDGTFSLLATAGPYHLMVTTPDGQSAAVPIDGVSQKITVLIGAKAKVSGNLKYSQPHRIENVVLLFEPIDSFLYQSCSIKVTPSGSFGADNIAAARFHVDVQGLPKSAYVKSMQVNGKEVPDHVIDLRGAGTGRLDVELGSAGGVVEGIVVDGSNQALPSATVMLVPADVLLTDRYKTTKTNASGSFFMSGIAPGPYKILAGKQDLDDEFYYQGGLLPPFDSAAIPITIRDGEERRIQLTAISNY